MESEPIPEKMITKTDLEAAQQAAENVTSERLTLAEAEQLLCRKIKEANQLQADLAASQRQACVLRLACRAALDWATGYGQYANDRDTITTLAEEVAPMLEIALSSDAAKGWVKLRWRPGTERPRKTGPLLLLNPVGDLRIVYAGWDESFNDCRWLYASELLEGGQ